MLTRTTLCCSIALGACASDPTAKPPADTEQRDSAAQTPTTDETAASTGDTGAVAATGDTAAPTGGAGRLSGELDRTDAFAEVLGVSMEESIGYAFGAAGDVNGDGFDDLLIGTTSDDSVATDNGAVHLLHGPLSGSVDVSSAVATFTGTAGSDHAGWLVESAGDVNGDGFADVLGQAHRYDGASYHSGLAFIAFGPVAGTHLVTEADIVLLGVGDTEALGMGIASLGDTNGDGRSDIAVGAALIAPGTTYIWHESLVAGQWTSAEADASVVGESSGGSAGLELAGMGDATGDGLGDLLVSDFWYTSGFETGAGAAYVVQAPFAGTTGVEDALGSIRGTASFEHIGIRVEAGDLNGDGTLEPIVQSYSPSVVLVFGNGLFGEVTKAESTASIEIDANAEGALACVGDLDEDGYDDLLETNRNADSANGGGGGWLFYGPLSGRLTVHDAAASLVAAANNEFLGSAAAAAGDLNADGIRDFVVGAAGTDGFVGGGYLFSGQPSP